MLLLFVAFVGASQMSRFTFGRGIVTTAEQSSAQGASSSESFDTDATSVGAKSKTLFHLQEQVDIYGSATLSAAGDRLLLSQATNYNADSKLNVIDLTGAAPNGAPVWTLVDDQMVAVRPDHNLATAEFGALSTNFVINGSHVNQVR
jgi:hypothetical protein